MTTLDDMKLAWQAMDQKLDASLRLNFALLRSEQLNRVRSPLRMLTLELAVEIVASAAGLVWLGSFLADHISQFRVIWPAGLLDAWLVLCLGTSIRQLILANSINYHAPVTAIQRQLGELRLARLGSIRWILLTGQAVWWTPFYLLLLRLQLGGDGTAASALHDRLLPFMVVNLCFSVALIPVSILIARKFSGPLERSGWLRWLADQVAGGSLQRAERFLDELSTFERS